MPKLVRDRIPEIVEANGEVALTRRLTGDELLQALFDKLEEEALELRAEPSLEELADVAEVLVALAEKLGYSAAEVERARVSKREARGAFSRGLYLEAVRDG